jgi:hypothetical protein
MSKLNRETVLSVHHWTDTLFSFTTTRDPGFLSGMRALLEGMGMAEGNQTGPAEYVIEKAFAER